MSRSIKTFLNQAEKCMGILNVVLENAAFCFHSALLLLENNTRKGRQWKKARLLLQKERVQ